MLSEQEILNEVTGSNAQLGADLAGTNLFAPQGLDTTGLNNQGGLSPLPSLPGIGGAPAGSNSGGFFGNLFNPNSVLSGAAQTIQGSSSGNSSGGAWAFITDVPRVATTVVGFIIITVGLISLTHGAILHNDALPAGARGSTERG